MEEHKKDLLVKLVKRYNFLYQRAFNVSSDTCREALELRAAEVLFAIDELFGVDSVRVIDRKLSQLIVRKD